MDPVLQHTYFENYRLDAEVKESFSKLVQQLGQTQACDNNEYLRKVSTLFNTHTEELIEGYSNPDHKNEAGLGIEDFVNQMVLRFKNEHEQSLYFEAVD